MVKEIERNYSCRDLINKLKKHTKDDKNSLENTNKKIELNKENADLMFKSGHNYYNLGDFNSALKYYNESLRIQVNIFIEGHPDIVKSLNNVCLSYYGLGDFENALRFYNQSIKMQKKLYTGNHPDIAKSLNNGEFLCQRPDDFESELHKELFDSNEKILSKLKEIDRLDLSSNKFELNSSFFSMLNDCIKLVSVNLSKSNLISIQQDYFKNLINLEMLDLSFNRLSFVQDNCFSSLGKLKVLKLNNNRLESLSFNAFNGLGNLKQLMLGYNRLQTLDSRVFWHFKNLKLLDLSFNHFWYLPSDALSWLINIEIVAFFGYESCSYSKHQIEQSEYLYVLNDYITIYDNKAPFIYDFTTFLDQNNINGELLNKFFKLAVFGGFL